MAKRSPAKAKMIRAAAVREAAKRRAEKASEKNAPARPDVEPDPYAQVDGAWRSIGLAAPARRALIDDGLYKLSDLRKVSLDAIKELHGLGPNAIRILVAELKKADLSFRN